MSKIDLIHGDCLIGIELDENYFEIAKNRIEKPQELTETKE